MFKTEFENLRRTCPLIHNITNYVTVNDCANMVLACGASPIMADDAAEVEDITTICGGLNINAVRFDSELDRAKEKMDCGVSAFLTQPVLSEQAALHLERARDELRGAKLIGGLFPVVSEKNARFLQSEVHGITVDEAVVRAYAGLDRAQGEDMAVRLCREAASRISPFVDGYYMMTPFQRVELVCRVIRATRNLAE